MSDDAELKKASEIVKSWGKRWMTDPNIIYEKKIGIKYLYDSPAEDLVQLIAQALRDARSEAIEECATLIVNGIENIREFIIRNETRVGTVFLFEQAFLARHLESLRKEIRALKDGGK